MSNLTQKDFEVETLGPCAYPSPLPHILDNDGDPNNVIFQNQLRPGERLEADQVLTFEKAHVSKMLYFNPSQVNVGIVTCGGLCPGLNDVIRSVTNCCRKAYKVKNVYGFKHGYKGLTAEGSHDFIVLDEEAVDGIHEMGGTILSSSRGSQDIRDIVDTLVKFNISILFVIGGDGTQKGSMSIAEEIKKRKLKISVIGIPKTIDNDISFVQRTFGFYTAVEEARKAISAAHVEAKGTQNGIGIVKLMGRHSGFIAGHATLSSGDVNICLIPEVPFALSTLFAKIKQRLTTKDHLVIVVAEGAGQEFLSNNGEEKDASGNIKLKDIGLFLRMEIEKYLIAEKVLHSIKYIDPSYMIRSTPACAADSSFCLQLGNYAVHAGMAGKTNLIIGHWNQHFTLTPIQLAVSQKKMVDPLSAFWRSVEEITL